MQDILIGFADYGYIGLFVAAFLAATVLPFSSEIVFTTLLYTVKCDVWQCIIAASLGNFLGGMTCYFLGRIGKLEWIEKYLHVKENKIQKWLPRLQRNAAWATFFTFLPGVGDIFAIVAGFLRANIFITTICMLIGKFVRYIVWVWISYWAFL